MKNRNLDVLLKVRKAKQSQALAALGVETSGRCRVKFSTGGSIFQSG